MLFIAYKAELNGVRKVLGITFHCFSNNDDDD